ncbi:MAG: hypothetical protein RR661_04410, partial [Anaerovoracaceae bacterium]
YQAYALLKQFTEGSMEIHPSYTLFWQGDRLSVLVLNTHSTALSNLQLSTEFLPEKFYLSSIRYAQTDHCFSAYQRLGCPQRLPAHLVAQINEANSGVRQFSLVHQEQTPSLEFILYPESLLLLTISSVSD